MFYRGWGDLNSMFIEAISAAQKSEEPPIYNWNWFNGSSLTVISFYNFEYRLLSVLVLTRHKFLVHLVYFETKIAVTLGYPEDSCSLTWNRWPRFQPISRHLTAVWCVMIYLKIGWYNWGLTMINREVNSARPVTEFQLICPLSAYSKIRAQHSGDLSAVPDSVPDCI